MVGWLFVAVLDGADIGLKLTLPPKARLAPLNVGNLTSFFVQIYTQNIATALFVFTTPFLYQTGIEGRFLGVQFLILVGEPLPTTG